MVMGCAPASGGLSPEPRQEEALAGTQPGLNPFASTSAMQHQVGFGEKLEMTE